MARTLFKTVHFELSGLLQSIDLGKLALPELQRPFVWPATKVRDLFDSMYRGFPIGYVMLWQGDEVDSRYIGVGGKQQRPSETLVDGQQRLTSLFAVMKGKEVTFKDFSRGLLKLSFRPRDGHFEVADAATRNDPEYLSDISELWSGQDWLIIDSFIAQVREARPEAVADGLEGQLRNALGSLRALEGFPVQAMQIGPEVDEEQVAEIFLRVNSGGTSLTQADFILTLLSVFREEDRRRLERFAMLSRTTPTDGEPSPYNHLIAPSADQLLRVAVLVGFRRGRLQSVLALLRRGALDDEQSVAEQDRVERLDELSHAIDLTLDLTSWHEYLKILLSAGFRRSTEISSFNNVVLVYALYLIGRGHGLSHSQLRTTIARFFFMSALTGRYTGTFETQITQDVQALAEATAGSEYLDRLRAIISGRLTDDYWNITLRQEVATSAARSPELFAYAASLSLLGARVPPFVSAAGAEQKAAVLIRDLFDPLVSPRKAPVDRHHLFPRKYLESIGIVSTRAINQIGNLAYVEWPENIEISDTPPAVYWPLYEAQFTPEDRFHHALPDRWATMGYEEFLTERRKGIARVIKAGFESIGASPEAQTLGLEEVGASGSFADTYLHPDHPFSNELAVRQLIRQLRGDILWYEQHMDKKALEMLTEELPQNDVDVVRLLSGPANLTSRTKKSFAKFVQEFEHKGILCEWRVLNPGDARLMHARVMFDDGRAFELPPLSSVLAGGVDSIRESDMPREFFEQAWEGDTVALEDYATDT